MIKALFILTALALVQARPNDDVEVREADCELLDNGCPVDYTVNKNIAHEKYCHLFYTCVRGELVLASCPEPLYFDVNTEVCDWPWETNCVNDGPYTYPPTADATTPPNLDVGDLLDNGCPSNFSITHLLPHETCEQYYECNSGVKVVRNCGPGTVFNFLTQSCDWPSNVPHCADSAGATAAPVTPEDSKEILPNDPENWESLPNGCPVDPSINHLLPHGSECEKFYSCENGELVLMNCPPSTHFSPTLQICTWPHEAGCEWWTGGCPPGDCEECCDGPSAPSTTTVSIPTTAAATTTTTSAPTTTTTTTTSAPTTTTTTSAPTTTTTTTTSAPTTTTTSAQTTTTTSAQTITPTVIPVTTTTEAPESSEELFLPSDPETPGGWESLPNGCPADFDVHWLLPHEYDCDKFYYCAHGNKVLFPCPGGTHFSPTLQQCTWPELAGCEHWDGGCSSPGDGGSCDSQTTAVPVTTGPTTTVSAGTTVVVPTTNTAVPSTITAAPSTTTAVPSTTTAVPSTTTAVPSTTTAVPSTNTAVPSTTTTAPSTSTTIASPSTTVAVPVTTTSQPTTIRPDCPECPPGPANPADICKEECNVNPWPHPECDKFYSCVGNELQLNICSEGLHFNPTTFTCDFICNAGCVRNIPQVTRHSDGLLMFIPNGFENTENMIDLIEYKLKTEL